MHPESHPSNETVTNGAVEKLASGSRPPESIGPPEPIGPPESIAPPESIGGYRLERQIGRGGMSQVFQGRRREGDAPAAVKVLDARVAVDPSMRQRFDREVKAIQAMQSPHICLLYTSDAADDSVLV